MKKGWHNKHISTKLGVAIIVVLLIAMGFTVSILSQRQNNQSNAMYVVGEGGGTGCRISGVQGRCIKVTSSCATVGYGYKNSVGCSKNYYCCINKLPQRPK